MSRYAHVLLARYIGYLIDVDDVVSNIDRKAIAFSFPSAFHVIARRIVEPAGEKGDNQ
jgi:hypothetical protein